MCVCVSVNVYMCEFVYVDMCMYVCVNVYISVYVCLCVCACELLQNHCDTTDIPMLPTMLETLEFTSTCL